MPLRPRRMSDPLYKLIIRFSTNQKPLFFMLAINLAFQTSTYFAGLRETSERGPACDRVEIAEMQMGPGSDS